MKLCNSVEIMVYCFRTYTERNCKLECQANHTQQKCGCVPYFLPSKFDVAFKYLPIYVFCNQLKRKSFIENMNTTICGRQEEECSDKAKGNVYLVLKV